MASAFRGRLPGSVVVVVAVEAGSPGVVAAGALVFPLPRVAEWGVVVVVVAAAQGLGMGSLLGAACRLALPVDVNQVIKGQKWGHQHLRGKTKTMNKIHTHTHINKSLLDRFEPVSTKVEREEGGVWGGVEWNKRVELTCQVGKRVVGLATPHGIHHGLLDVSIDALEVVAAAGSRLHVENGAIIRTHHLLHHRGVGGDLHGLAQDLGVREHLVELWVALQPSTRSALLRCPKGPTLFNESCIDKGPLRSMEIQFFRGEPVKGTDLMPAHKKEETSA